MVPSFPKEMWKLEFWTTGLVQISTKKFVGRGEQQQQQRSGPEFGLSRLHRHLRPGSGEIPGCLRIVFN